MDEEYKKIIYALEAVQKFLDCPKFVKSDAFLLPDAKQSGRKGVISADPGKFGGWASFIIRNKGDSDIFLYPGKAVKLEPTDAPLVLGPYFNNAARVDRIPYEFVGGATDRLEVIYDVYLEG